MATYETEISGIRILPGAWRPHYEWEQIAWISPPWPSQDYIWYDFPEAIFSNMGLLYLSHVNPSIQSAFAGLPKVPWKSIPGGISFQRRLPNGITFGGSLALEGERAISTELWIQNGADDVLDQLTLQTCLFLRAIKEFSSFTGENKFVHLAGKGWTPFPEAIRTGEGDGRYRLGWRSGPLSADLPIMATISSAAERLVASTWFNDTYSLVTNPGHPCMHADPAFSQIKPGEKAVIRGGVFFHEGTLEEFTDLAVDWVTKRV
jgi:hypothetical protein